MFVNDHERKKNDKSLLAALKKMVDSKELILTSMNGIPCYKLSDDPVLSCGGKDKDEASHEKSSLPNLVAPDKYTDMIKSALKYLKNIERKKEKEQYLSIEILEYLYANSMIKRKSKTDKNHFNEALKKMVASKELIECTKKTRSKKNSISYYTLSNN